MLSPDALRQAIATENLVPLSKVPGIGRKGAQRIVIELKDKINAVRLGPSRSRPAATAAAGGTRSPRGCRASAGRPGTPTPACDEAEHLVADDPEVGVPC